MMPVISVIVPVYNAEQYLSACLDSVAGQSYAKLEIILVNDGSTDHSGVICEDYANRDDRIQVLHKSNGGPASARNAGLDAATGDWIAFVDSDDYADPDLCVYLLSLALEHNSDLVQCGAFWEDENSSKPMFLPNQNRVFAQGVYGFDSDAWFCFGNGNWGKLYRREVIGTTRFDPEYMIGEDLYFNFQVLAQAENVVLGAEPKYHYIQTPYSLFRAAPSREKLLSCRRMLQKAQKEFEDCDVLRIRIEEEWYRNGLDICSKIVFFGMEQEQDVCKMVRNEIRRNLGKLCASKSFSRNEKLKFFLIARAWPLYCKLLLWSKKTRRGGTWKTKKF